MDGQQATPQSPVRPPIQPPVPPAAPAAKQQMQAGLGAVGAQPKPLGEGDISQQIGNLQSRMQKSQSETTEEIKSLGKPPTVPEYHPIPPKDASEFFGLMMVLGALGGRSTMAPMTAAMNNMTAIMKAQKEGNKEMLAAQKEQFNTNFDVAMAKHKEYTEAKKDILERNKYDMKAAEEELRGLRLQHGISDAVAKATETSHWHDQNAAEKLQSRKDKIIRDEKKAAEAKSGSVGEMMAKKSPTMFASVQMDLGELEYALKRMEALDKEGASAGVYFGSKSLGATQALERMLTLESQQQYEVVANRVAIALSSLQAMGRGLISDTKVRESRNLVPVVTDKSKSAKEKYTALRRLLDISYEALNSHAGDKMTGGEKSTPEKTYSSKDELQAAIGRGEIKKGDTFADPSGGKHTVQ